MLWWLSSSQGSGSSARPVGGFVRSLPCSRNHGMMGGTFSSSTIRPWKTAPNRGISCIDPSTVAAIDFFQGSKIPAALVTGASMAALFAMTDGVNNTYGMSKLQILLLRLYHIASLLSFCLSLSSIVTSSTATTLLLVSDYTSSSSSSTSMDVYRFLRSNLNFEFLFTRWSLLVSVGFLCVSTTIRMLLQFELFRPKRRLAGWSVVSAMTGMMAFLIGHANTTQHCWPSFWGMTKEVLGIFWRRAFLNCQPMFLLSMVSFGVSAILTIRFLMPGAVEHDQMLDSDRYT